MENKALRKTVFLDRDGTINEEVSYLHKVEDFRFLPHVLEGLSILSKPVFNWWWLRTKPESEEAITEKRMQRHCIDTFGKSFGRETFS